MSLTKNNSIYDELLITFSNSWPLVSLIKIPIIYSKFIIELRGVLISCETVAVNISRK